MAIETGDIVMIRYNGPNGLQDTYWTITGRDLEMDKAFPMLAPQWCMDGVPGSHYGDCTNIGAGEKDMIK